tara:strand:+ start:380 stop:634 length:255 start_codon:yes stop_codon:yes gene_type:complete
MKTLDDLTKKEKRFGVLLRTDPAAARKYYDKHWKDVELRGVMNLVGGDTIMHYARKERKKMRKIVEIFKDCEWEHYVPGWAQNT